MTPLVAAILVFGGILAIVVLGSAVKARLFRSCNHNWEVIDRTTVTSAFEQAKGDPVAILKELKEIESQWQLDAGPMSAFFEKCFIITLRCAHCGTLNIDKTTIGRLGE